MTTLGWSPLQLISEPAAQQCWYTTVSGCSPYCWGRPPAATRPALTAKSWYGCFVSGSFRTSLSKNLNVFQDIPLDGLDPPVQSPNPIHIFHFHIILAFRNGMPAIQTAYNDIHNMIELFLCRRLVLFGVLFKKLLSLCLQPVFPPLSCILDPLSTSLRLVTAHQRETCFTTCTALREPLHTSQTQCVYANKHIPTNHHTNTCACACVCAHTRTHTPPLLHMPLTPAV